MSTPLPPSNSIEIVKLHAIIFTKKGQLRKLFQVIYLLNISLSHIINVKYSLQTTQNERSIRLVIFLDSRMKQSYHIRGDANVVNR